jgi:hypothetical protein
MADASEDAAATPAPVQTASIETPASVPFGMAQMAAADVPADPVQAAVNTVPLPTWRPDTSAKPAELAVGDQSAVLLALADTADHGNAASDALSVLPTARPDEIGDLVKKASTDDYQVASLAPVPPRSAFSDPHGIDAATPRDAVARRPAGSDPVAAIGGNVKTTRKEARATAQDVQPGPKSIAVAAQPELARWALHGDEAASADSNDAPQLAYNMVRTAPSEAYTMGFQTGDEMANANRFTGPAVQFLPVAKFAK